MSSMHPILRELGLTPGIIAKHVVSVNCNQRITAELSPSRLRQEAERAERKRCGLNTATGDPKECPSRLKRRELRAERRRLGLNTHTGKPLVNERHPELAGLDKNTYNKMIKLKAEGLKA